MNPGRKIRRFRAAQAGVVVIIAVALVSTLLPIYFVVIAALDPMGGLATSSLIPRGISFDNFANLFQNPRAPFPLWMVNSLVVTVAVTIITTLVVASSAYAFSRMRFRGREALLQTVLLLQVFPNILAIVAIFLLVQQLGTLTPLLGLNSLLALVVVYVGASVGGNVWLLKGYMDSIPIDIDESAKIDGASHWIVFSRLLLPLVRPMLAVVAVLTFVAAYSEILIVQVIVRDPQFFTLPLGLYTMSIDQFRTDWGLFAAGAIVAAIPPLVLFYSLQRWLVAGLTQGAVKA